MKYRICSINRTVRLVFFFFFKKKCNKKAVVLFYITAIVCSYIAAVHPKDEDGMSNSAGPDRTAV